MPFQIKGGVPGQRISFEKEPNVDVGLWLFLKDGHTSGSSRYYGGQDVGWRYAR